MPRIEIDFRANFEKYMSDFKKALAETTSGVRSISDTIQKVVGFSLFGYGASQLLSFGIEAAKSAAQLDVLRNSFDGTSKEIELFKRATAGTVTEANLIKLSNQATDLGLSFEEQAILMSFAEDAADKYGGSVEENFQKVLKASEGGSKGLKDLGIQKAKYDEIVEKYLKEIGVKQLEQLDAEGQKWVRLRALIEATGLTLDDVNSKTQDAADRIESFGTKFEELKTTLGGFTSNFGKMLIDYFMLVWEWATKADNALDRFLGTRGLFGQDDGGAKPPDRKEEKEDLAASQKNFTYVKNGKVVSTPAPTKQEEELARLKAEAAEKKAEEARKKKIKEYEERAKAKPLSFGIDGYYAGIATQDFMNNQQTMSAAQMAGGTNYVAKENRPQWMDQQYDVYGLNNAMEQLGDTSKRSLDMMASGLARAITRGESLKEVFANIGETILSSGLQLLFSIGLRAGAMALGVPSFLFANGGVIGEPVYGLGLNSKKSYMFGEAGSEVVIPSNRFSGGGAIVEHRISISTEPLRGDMRTMHAGLKARQSLDDQYR